MFAEVELAIAGDSVRSSQLRAIGHRIEPRLLSERERRLPAQRALCESVEEYLKLTAVAHLFELHCRLADSLTNVPARIPAARRLQDQAALAAGTMWSAGRFAREQSRRGDEDELDEAAAVTLELVHRPGCGATAIALAGAHVGVQALAAGESAHVVPLCTRAVGHAVALYLLATGRGRSPA